MLQNSLQHQGFFAKLNIYLQRDIWNIVRHMHAKLFVSCLDYKTDEAGVAMALQQLRKSHITRGRPCLEHPESSSNTKFCSIKLYDLFSKSGDKGHAQEDLEKGGVFCHLWIWMVNTTPANLTDNSEKNDHFLLFTYTHVLPHTGLVLTPSAFCHQTLTATDANSRHHLHWKRKQLWNLITKLLYSPHSLFIRSWLKFLNSMLVLKRITSLP